MAVETVPQLFLYAVETYDKGDAFRHKVGGRWEDVSHRDVLERVHHVALGLQALNLAKGDRVALISENRLEWAVADLAIQSAGYVTVPIYPTLPADQVEYALGDSEARAVFVSDEAQLAKVRECRARTPKLLHVFSFDPDCDPDAAMPLRGLAERGRLVEPKPTLAEMTATVGRTDTASIIYTSGTTGRPKGTVLSHHNFVSNTKSCLEVFDITPEDTYLSFLPLSHAFERTGGFYVMVYGGATICYAESVETIFDDMRAVSPTVICSVPRLYEKMYARIVDTARSSSGMRRGLFEWAVRAGRRYVSEELAGGAGALTRGKRNLAHALVFKRIHARTGGKLRFCISGAAPLPREIAEFFHSAGIPILEGYGLTETSPVIAVNSFENLRFGTVGKPAPGVEVKIAEDGEILVRGDNVMQGYYKMPEDTNEVMEDGWFRTGDIGRLDEDGFLVITDRKKDIIVTAGGKNIAPQKIESRLKRSPYIGEVVVVGNGRKFIAVVVVPDFRKLDEFAAAAGVRAAPGDVSSSAEIADLFQREVDALCADLAPFEKPRKTIVVDHELTIGDGELTPTMKVKRRVIEEKYREAIDALYEE
jgi:long-chain acyl-CoA synthetase